VICCKPQWKEIVELPKLTTKVFDHPDCPKWVKWAAVDEDGTVVLFETRPTSEPACKWWGRSGKYCLSGLMCDPSDWQNSLVERPAKLPDWCKAGEWVWATTFNTYFKIDEVDALFIGGKGISGNDYSVKSENVRQARLRPYKEEEMKALVGKVLTSKSRSNPFSFLVVYAEGDGSFIESHRFKYTAKELKDFFTVDGKPCGVLEHLEEGAWVK
jgi:hypothetical protein